MHDGLGRTVSVAQPGGDGTTAYEYQGNVTKVTDPAGKWKTFTTDALGNLVKVTEPNPAGGSWDTLYTYDALNHLTGVSMTRPSGSQTRTFVYDSTTQRLTSANNPETGTVTYSYNADGTLAYQIDAKNQKVAYAYDGYGRVLQVNRYPVASGLPDPCQRVTYTYDLIELDGYYENIKNVGRLSGAHWGAPDGTCPGQYSFDELYGWTAGGLLAQKELLLSGGMWYEGELVARYWYDPEGKNVTAYQPPNIGGGYIQYTYTYTYDALGRPLRMTDTRYNQTW